jgi:hypothetical protein
MLISVHLKKHILIVIVPVCTIYIHPVFTSNRACVYSFHSADPLTTEHMISMTTTSKTSIKSKLLFIKEKLHIINITVATQNVPPRKTAKEIGISVFT